MIVLRREVKYDACDIEDSTLLLGSESDIVLD